MRRVEGTIKGELSPGTYADLIAAALRRDFSAGAVVSGASLTVAGSGPAYTVTRAAGSFLTDGIKAGDVVQLAGGFNAANAAKNLLVVSLTATVLNVLVLNGSALVAEGPIASASVTVQGKKTFVPASGHADKYPTFEHWYADINQSEQFTDCKVGQLDVSLPATGMATISPQLRGIDMKTGTGAYFTAPAAETAAGVVAAVNGVLLVGVCRWGW